MPSTQRSLVWCGPVFEPTGYADELRGMVEGLEAANTPVRLYSTSRESAGFRDTLPTGLRSTLERSLARPVSDSMIMVQHATIDSFGVTGSNVGYRVGRSMFETDGLPSHWLHGANALDELWVTGEFNRDTFARAGVRVPMHIIPGGIDSAMFRPSAPRQVAGARGTVFLSVFEWRLRKGWDVLLRAWAQAFTPDDDVSLVLRTYPISQVDGLRNNDIIARNIDMFLRDECGGRTRRDVAPIIIIGERVSASDLPSLYSMANAFVLPTRGEGWGRPFMESMSCGVPVIATNWSAHTAFMNAENSYLVDVDGLVSADHSEIAAYIGQRWAAPSVQHLTTQLRRVHTDRAEARAIGERARKDMVNEWPWSRAATAIQARLREINATLDDTIERTNHMTLSTSKLATVVEGNTSDTSARTNNTNAWLSAAAAASASTSASVAVSAKCTPTLFWRSSREIERPSYSSPEYAWWTRAQRAIAAPAEAVAESTVHVTILDDDARLRAPMRPVSGRWIIDVDALLADGVPAHLVTTLRDQADGVVVPHTAARAYCIAVGVEESRIHVVPPLVDSSRFTPVGAAYRRATSAVSDSNADVNSSTRFLVIGGDRPHRSLQHIVATYERTFTSQDDVVMHVVLPTPRAGEANAWRTQLLAIQRSNKRHPLLPRLMVDAERIERDELPALYRSADVLIHAGANTGTARTLREALLCGVPVIATDSEVTRVVLTEQCGWLVPADQEGQANAADLALAMRDACSLAARSLRKEAARAHGESVNDRSTDEQVRQLCIERARAKTSRATEGDDHIVNATAFPLEGARQLVILAHADWHSGMLPAIAHTYARAVSASDDVTLAVCLDPAQNVAIEQAHEWLQRAMRLAGRTDDNAPDVLLVADSIDGTVIAQLRAAADLVVAVRDPVAHNSALRAGTPVISSLHAASWRMAIQQRLAALSSTAVTI